MKTHLAPLVLVALLAGCNEGDSGADAADAYPSNQDLSSGAPQALMVTPQRQWIARDESASNKVESGQDSGASQEAAQERRIAEVQSWQYELNPQVLKSTWQAQRDACMSLNQSCEILQANLSTRGQANEAQHGLLQMRVSRDNLDAFEQDLESAGPAPVEKSIFREDRTLQWTDLHSRKQSAEQLRDRLKAMVANHQTDKLSDLLALERELNRVQSTLDSMTAQARVMAGETEKVRINITYRSTPQTVARDLWSPIRDAWHNMGRTFAQSIAAAMLFVAGALPWIVILVPGWVLLRKLWTRLKRGFSKKTAVNNANLQQ